MRSPFVFHASAAAAAGFAALAGLVAAGGTNGIDEWAVNHAMPGACFTGGKSSLVDAVIPCITSTGTAGCTSPPSW